MSIPLRKDQQEMVLKNRKLVFYVLNRLGNILPGEYEDLVSIGYFALVKAVQNFDESKNMKFSTYAITCIKNELLQELRKNNIKQQYLSTLSLDGPIPNRGNDISDLSIVDMISDDLDIEDHIENADTIARIISYILNCIPHNIAAIVLLSTSDLSQKEIASILGISRSYVSRLENKGYSQTLKNYLYEHEEVFKVSIKEHRFQIVFFDSDVDIFKQFWSDLLKSMIDVDNLLEFKINCIEDQVTLLLPFDINSFILLASILEKVNFFKMIYTGFSREIIRTDYSSRTNDSSSPTPIETNMDTSEKKSTNSEKSK
ncbi:MAG: sigma-70 family RNA polymerase sigma factor [Lachnospiraceae bacterium]|jgi:RNA polymerase sporulation-specific sigma factor|nr:sigma-70 family RNA polymerase sigma factor [Lachnospiraceae bacterium]